MFYTVPCLIKICVFGIKAYFHLPLKWGKSTKVASYFYPSFRNCNYSLPRVPENLSV